MIALGVISALGWAEQDAINGLAVVGAGSICCLLIVGVIFVGGKVHDRRHGCKNEHGRPLSRRERAVLDEIEAQGDLGNSSKGSRE